MARNTAEPIVIEGNTGTALADFAEIERQALAQMQQRIQAPSGNGISIRDKQFKFPDGRVADSLNVVVLDFVTRNLYYVGRFDPKNPAPPTCFAIGKDLKTLKPSANSADVQNEAGCATCENNTFGSNGAAKACKNTRLLAVLEVGEDYATAPIYTISVPPKSLKAFDGYINTIGSCSSVPTGACRRVSASTPKRSTSSSCSGTAAPTSRSASASHGCQKLRCS